MTRLIDADKLKQYIDDCECCKKCNMISFRCNDYCELPDCVTPQWERVLNEQQTVDAIPFKWIPCSEQLPEEVGTYLVTINYHGNTYVYIDNFHPSGWEWDAIGLTRLAWAKVPEPYKGETE